MGCPGLAFETWIPQSQPAFALRPNGSVNYTYDAMNRVTSAKTLGTACTTVAGGTLNWGESFTVDAWGNLIDKTTTLCTAEALSSSASPRNQLAAATYDSAGNAIANNAINYTYDAEGRITAASGAAYIYDGASERVGKTGTLYWKGAGSEALVESSAANTNPTRYIFFNGKRIARIDPGATTAKYYVQDNVGSTALVTDSLGNPLSESLFFPYGGEQAILSNDTNTYKFTGKQRDPETGLDDFGARYYASNLGRFMSPDWAAKPVTVPYANFGDPQTLNLYSYVENGPLNRVDADGHAASQGGDNNWLGFDEGPCAGTWSTPSEETHKDNLGSASLSGEAADEDAYDGLVAASQQSSPDPKQPVNKDYVLAVENDSGSKMGQYDAREVEYDLHNTPDASHPNGSILGSDVKSTVITEHLSNKVDFKESSSHTAGQFEDTIGPGGCQMHGCKGTVTTERYFTVEINGKQMGVVPILDRNGTHLVDHIAVDRTNDRTILNGQKGPTDVP